MQVWIGTYRHGNFLHVEKLVHFLYKHIFESYNSLYKRPVDSEKVSVLGEHRVLLRGKAGV